MKFNYLVKTTPLLTTLLLIICLTFSNQKQNTKLRILIWDTPSLKLGTYLAISTGTGFILSYLITTNLGNLNQISPKQSISFKETKTKAEINEFNDIKTKTSYDNTLIERDIKDPSPTINASFRIIGRKERVNTNFINNKNNTYYEDTFELDDQYDEPSAKNQDIIKDYPVSSDWNDESYSTW